MNQNKSEYNFKDILGYDKALQELQKVESARLMAQALKNRDSEYSGSGQGKDTPSPIRITKV